MEMNLAGDKSDSVPDYDIAVFFCYLKSVSAMNLDRSETAP
jgi:hypothetical protein